MARRTGRGRGSRVEQSDLGREKGQGRSSVKIGLDKQIKGYICSQLDLQSFRIILLYVPEDIDCWYDSQWIVQEIRCPRLAGKISWMVFGKGTTGVIPSGDSQE